VRCVDVDQVVDRVQARLDREQPQHRRAPRAAADRDQARDAARGVERREVAHVVVVARAVRADVFEEGMRCEGEHCREREVHERERDQPREDDRVVPCRSAGACCGVG